MSSTRRRRGLTSTSRPSGAWVPTICFIITLSSDIVSMLPRSLLISCRLALKPWAGSPRGRPDAILISNGFFGLWGRSREDWLVCLCSIFGMRIYNIRNRIKLTWISCFLTSFVIKILGTLKRRLYFCGEGYTFVVPTSNLLPRYFI